MIIALEIITLCIREDVTKSMPNPKNRNISYTVLSSLTKGTNAVLEHS